MKAITSLLPGHLGIYGNEKADILTKLGSALNSSDVRVVRVSASGAANLGLIPSRIKPMTLKLVFTTSLIDTRQ